jgi:TonB-dependent starch-binding outer membrane protein SusC
MKQFILIIALFAATNATAQTVAPSNASSIKVIQKSGKVANENPLLVLDGVVLNTPTDEAFQAQLKAIDPNSIEKMDVLKGEAAQKSIYSDKAANGIILITTKKK